MNELRLRPDVERQIKQYLEGKTNKLPEGVKQAGHMRKLPNSTNITREQEEKIIRKEAYRSSANVVRQGSGVRKQIYGGTISGKRITPIEKRETVAEKVARTVNPALGPILPSFNEKAAMLREKAYSAKVKATSSSNPLDWAKATGLMTASNFVNFVSDGVQVVTKHTNFGKRLKRYEDSALSNYVTNQYISTFDDEYHKLEAVTATAMLMSADSVLAAYQLSSPLRVSQEVRVNLGKPVGELKARQYYYSGKGGFRKGLVSGKFETEGVGVATEYGAVEGGRVEYKRPIPHASASRVEGLSRGGDFSKSVSRGISTTDDYAVSTRSVSIIPKGSNRAAVFTEGRGLAGFDESVGISKVDITETRIADDGIEAINRHSGTRKAVGNSMSGIHEMPISDVPRMKVTGQKASTISAAPDSMKAVASAKSAESGIVKASGIASSMEERIISQITFSGYLATTDMVTGRTGDYGHISRLWLRYQASQKTGRITSKKTQDVRFSSMQALEMSRIPSLPTPARTDTVGVIETAERQAIRTIEKPGLSGGSFAISSLPEADVPTISPQPLPMPGLPTVVDDIEIIKRKKPRKKAKYTPTMLGMLVGIRTPKLRKKWKKAKLTGVEIRGL